MKKINALWIVLNSIFLIVFNALFFVLGGTDHNASVWLSYGFIHFAYMMLLVTPKLISGSAAVLGFSIFSISTTYFLIEFVTGMIFILLSLEGYKVALLVQLCIAGLYGIILVSNMIANERTAEAEEKRQPRITYIKDASAKLKDLLEGIGDKEVRKKVERVYDALYSSPVKSHPDLAKMENNILMSIKELETLLLAGEKNGVIPLANSLLVEVNKRNSRLKTLGNL